MMRVIRWGLIGCGEVTEVKSGPGFQKANNSTIVAVMRRNGKLAKDYAIRHNIAKWYDDADKLIHDPEVDAVYVATPPASHKEYAIRCIRAGKPVYVEKPMALNFADCQIMIQESEAAKVPLYIAYYRRALPQFIKIKELIESGIIGDVRFVAVRHFEKPLKEEIEGKNLPWRILPEISGGGKFLDMGCHTLDILDYILGPIEEVQGSIDNQAKLYQADDIVTGNFVFESGVQGIGVWCFSAFKNYEMNEIIGSKGKIEFSVFGSEPVVVTTEKNITRIPTENPDHVQQPLIQSVVNELNEGSPCLGNGKSAARTSLVIDQIVKNYYKK